MLYVLFFLSGFPALIYQIVWQRALFSIYGVNVESVTVVVSAFMLGLGLGSLAGGRLSRRPNLPLLLVFGGVELGIAAFGLVSLPLFRWVAAFTAGAPALETGAIAFGLVLFPTLLMGATLPLLVAHLVRISGNVGRSVGILYFVNTLGSAAACFVAALFTMRRLGMSGSVAMAAALNCLVGVSVLALHFRWRYRTSRDTSPPGDSIALLPFPVALGLAGAAGFISLGYEIVWYRVYSFLTGGSPRSFAYVLGAFLAGIAFGSLGVRRLCRGRSTALFLRSIARLVLAANLLGFASVPLVAWAVTRVDYWLTLPLVTLSAALLGAAFPLICHVSVAPDERAGAGLGTLYLSNILGSAAGSWLVGFVLMDIWPLRRIAVFLALLGMCAALALLAAAGARQNAAALGLGAAACAAILAASGPLFASIYERLQLKKEFSPGYHFTGIVETRGGVITVDEEAVIYGGGVFDGVLSTDLRQAETAIRPFSLSYIHPAPREVLLIGMAGGAWCQIVANHPAVEKAVIVEINPGYLAVIRNYPDVAPLLRNPKVDIVIDDGRRWMVRNRNRRFDAILMDTTHHWRAHATNLLSVEFLQLARGMLKPGGVLYYNTTYSDDAQLTGVTLFPYALRFGPFLAVSDTPLRLDAGRWRDTLLAYRLEGKPVLDVTEARDRDRLEELLRFAATEDSTGDEAFEMESAASIRRRTRGRRPVTDDNMATEWSQ
ncbi:MAG: spermidine synthase [Acidobacteria bacterium]|nr:spermidine synthase [Acidobacteriota bacterium]